MKKNFKKHSGITLIALIITIIVMLILVAVTINMAINGGLFEKAGEAVGDTKNAINAEQKLADGKIKIGDFWYASIDDYLNNNPITTGITVDKATLELKKKESAEVEGEEVLEGSITASVFGMEQEPEITWEVAPADQTAVTLSGTTGKTITVTAVGTVGATVTITAKCTYEGTEYTASAEVNLKIIPILRVGDYVNYTPDTGTYKVADGATGSGRDTTAPGYQEFTTGTGLQWRVWSIKENAEGDIEEVEIVLAGVGPSLTLKGADGYNHSVDILNDLCENLYSKTKADGTKVAIGRSINVEDINSKTTYSPIGETYTSTGFIYGDRKQLSTFRKYYRKYPNLYSQEIGYGTGGTFNTTGLDEEAGLKNGTTDERGVTTYPAMGYTDGNIAGTDIYVTHTEYGYNGSSYTYYPENCLDTSLGVNTASSGLINLSSRYWLASRCVSARSDGVGFDLRFVDSNDCVHSMNLFWSAGTAAFPCLAVRPVVTLMSNVSLVYDSAESTSSTTYWTAVFED